VCGACGSDPKSIVRHAKKRYREEKEAGDRFDKVYCVFDRDTHAGYAEALDAIARATPKDTYIAITSIPCFEYWLLLHFRYTTKPYEPAPGQSACSQVIADLKQYLPDYAKGQVALFSRLIDQLNDAKHNAQRVLQAAGIDRSANPSTRVHELIDFLQNIKKETA